MSAIKIALGLASITMGAIKVHEAISARRPQGLGDPSSGLGRAHPLQRMPAGATFTARGPFQQRRIGGGPVIKGSPYKMTIYPVKSLDDRIARIRERVARGMVDPQVYSFARRVVNKKCGDRWCIPEKDNLREMQAIFNAVRKDVRYTSDILGVDTYQHPKHTLGLNGGDCDDYSSLLCSLLLSLGIPCRLKVIRTKDAKEWNHIFAEGGLPRAAPQKWWALDASVPKPFGWSAPSSMVAESRIFSVR